MTKNARMTDPGEMSIETFDPGWAAADNAKARKRMASICATPEEIAGPIVFLCSDLARHITGEILNVNGGSVLPG